MTNRNIIAGMFLLASTIPALADGKEDTLAIISMAIAENECGLKPNQEHAQRTAQSSLAFTGLSREQYISSISDAIAYKTEQMYTSRTIGRFASAKIVMSFIWFLLGLWRWRALRFCAYQ